MTSIKKNSRNYFRCIIPYFIFLLMAFLVIFPQIHHHIFIAGLDSYFHMNRFYEDAMQIKTGHFSYFQSLFSFKQTGRIVNAFYGPWFSYLMGLLLLVMHSWLRFQIFFSFFAIFLSAAFMYRLLRYNRVKYLYSIVISLIYSISFPVKVLIFKQEFTGIGAVLFPLIILLGTKMVRKRRVNAVPLAITMAIIFQIHLLSGLISGLLLLPFVIFMLENNNYQKKLLVGITKAFGLFLILTANLWGAILEVYSSTHIVPTFPKSNMTGPIDAISLSRQARYLLLTPIDLKLLALILVLIIIGWYWMNNLTRMISVMGIISFWLSSSYFPWNYIAQRIPLLENVIQFPKRFLPLVYVLSLLALGIILSRINLKNKRPNRALSVVINLGLIIVLMATFVNIRRTMNTAASRWYRPRVLNFSNLIAHRSQPRMIRRSLTKSNYNVNSFIKVIPDYLPTSLKSINTTNYGNLYVRTKNQLDNKNPNYHKTVTPNGALQLKWKNRSSHYRRFKVPLVKYGHTKIKFNHQRIPNHKIKITSIGAMIINSRPGINRLQIQYHSSLVFKCLMAVNILSWLLIIIYQLFNKNKKKFRPAK